MVSGIIIFESGESQILGNPTSLKQIIQNMRELIPQLMQREQEQVLSTFSSEELEQLLAQKKAQQQVTDDIRTKQ